MVITIPLLLPYGILYSIKRNDLAAKYAGICSTIWGRLLLWAAGATVTVAGLERLPASSQICFVSNHQGSFDIPLIIGYIPRIVGFIAKKELKLFPIVNVWMRALHCIFLDRKNVRAALRVIHQGAQNIRDGHALVIFPEGTRSRSRQPGIFKKGSFHLPLSAGGWIIPLCIDGTWKLKEKHHRIQAGSVRLTILEPIAVETLNEETKKKIHEYIYSIIVNHLNADIS